jgi:hypothetical protein
MVKKNTSIELAANVKGMAYMLCILVCAMFLPLLSALSEWFVKSSLDEAVSSIVYRFHSNWRIYILLC